MSSYSDADYRADLLAMTLALLPTLDRWLAEVGLTRSQAMAMMKAGEPPPTRGVVSATHPHPTPTASVREEVPRERKSKRAA
jgi:hypothetical protein